MIKRVDENKISVQTLSQMDFKMQVTPALVNMMLGKSVKAWYDNVVKYYTSNNKKIS